MAWTEEQEEELRQLYIENQRNPASEQGNVQLSVLHLDLTPELGSR